MTKKYEDLETMVKKMMRTAVINDLHVPFEDKESVMLVRGFLKDVVKPDELIFNGDIADVYSVSKYDKDPLRKQNIQDEIDATYNVLCDFRNDLPKTKMSYNEGNHENRLERYLRRNPELAGIGALKIDKLLELGDLDIEYFTMDEQNFVGDMLVTHGDIVRSQSGYTAKAHLDKYNCDVLIGHTHRGGTHYKTTVGNGLQRAYENFCLCELNPSYVNNPNWQQGLSIIHTDTKTGLQRVEQLPIIDGKLVYEGKVYQMKKKGRKK